MMVAWLPRSQGSKPIFISEDEYRSLVLFLREDPDEDTPRLLVLLGTIKSGKSTLLEAIEPIVVALREDAPDMHNRLPPVLFKYVFSQRCQASAAADDLAAALRDFAGQQGIALLKRDSSSLQHIAAVAGEVSRGVHDSGRQLWLLFDETQGPILGSTYDDSIVFMECFKKVCLHRE